MDMQRDPGRNRHDSTDKPTIHDGAVIEPRMEAAKVNSGVTHSLPYSLVATNMLHYKKVYLLAED